LYQGYTNTIIYETWAEIHGSEGTLSYLAQAGDVDERVAFNFKCNNSEDNRVDMECKKDDCFNIRIDPFAPNDRPLRGEFYTRKNWNWTYLLTKILIASYTISKPDFIGDVIKPRGFDYSDW
jgi:hypothetical protein